MAINASGIMSGVRPNQPAGAPYTAPKINANDRTLDPNNKYAAAGTAAVYLPLALHHVIPWLYLWHFWNALVNKGWHMGIRDFLAILNVAKPTSAKAIEDMKKGTFSDTQNWETLVCWGTWNLVRGPENRTDDPNRYNVASPTSNDFDKIVDFLSYSSGPNASRIQRQVQRATTIRKCINGLWPSSEDALCGEIRSWKLDGRQGLVEWDAAMWKMVDASPNYVPGGHHGSAVHPKWKTR